MTELIRPPNEPTVPDAPPALRDLLEAASWARSQLPAGPRSGRVLVNRYALLEPIGAGGFGTVWRAWDQRIGVEVAVKLVTPEPDQGGPLPEAFENEIRALAQIRSPHVGRVLDSGREGDSLFMVLELEKGRPLCDVLEELRERTPPRCPPDMRSVRVAIRLPCPPGSIDLIREPSWFRFSARVVIAVLRALESSHDQGILHRDIKPANIVLRACGSPVLLDFGLACLRSERTRPAKSGLFGSLPYMAPEWLRGQRTGEDPRTDVYQIGIVLYEMLTLRAAFDATDRHDTVARIREGRVSDPHDLVRGLPRSLAAVCLRAIDARPDHRYQTAKSFREDLERWLGGRELPRAAQGCSLICRGRQLCSAIRRHPILAAGFAGFVLGCAATAIVAG